MTVSRIPNVEGGIQPTIVTAKGDLIAAVANASPARLGVGSDGTVLTADSSSATGVSWAGPLFVAGKNKIINGDFGVWQRGTSFNLTTVTWAFTADRFQCYHGFSSGTSTITRQTFTPGTAPVAGYESQYFLRFTAATTGTSNFNIKQLIEDVRTFAGQTVTFSFWAKSSASRNIDIFIRQNFGSGGSGSVDSTPATVSTTTAWQRFTYTVTLGSMTGKTIGTGSSVEIWPATSATVTGAETIDFWGWQVEAGSSATAFQTATGTIQGELAACQRYFQVIAVSQAWGTWYSTTDAALMAGLPVAMRVTPTATFSTVYTNAIVEVGVTDRTPTSYSAYKTSNQAFSFLANGMTTTATIRQGAVYIGPNHLLSAEL